MKRLMLLVALFLLCVATVSAQQADATLNIRVVQAEDYDGHPDATVRVSAWDPWYGEYKESFRIKCRFYGENDRQTRCGDYAGYFWIDKLQPGNYRVEAEDLENGRLKSDPLYFDLQPGGFEGETIPLKRSWVQLNSYGAWGTEKAIYSNFCLRATDGREHDIRVAARLIVPGKTSIEAEAGAFTTYLKVSGSGEKGGTSTSACTSPAFWWPTNMKQGERGKIEVEFSEMRDVLTVVYRATAGASKPFVWWDSPQPAGVRK